MKLKLTIICQHRSFSIYVDDVTASYGTLRFTHFGKYHVIDCDYFNVCSYPDSSVYFSCVLDFMTYCNLRSEIFRELQN